MSLFNLDWFKSEKEKQLKEEKLSVKILQQKVYQKQLQNVLGTTTTEQTTVPPNVHPGVYKSIKLAGSVLTVVLNDGAVISKSNATHGDFCQAREACNEQELIVMMTSEEGKREAKKIATETEKARRTLTAIQKLSQFKDFEKKDNALYLKGTSRSIPQILIDEFVDTITDLGEENMTKLETLLETNDRYQALKNFFLWCCLNPRAEVANELYEFLKKNSFRITKQGFFVALRNVVSLRGDDNHDLVDFVSNAYNKIKAVWKKKPSEFFVRMDNDGNYSFSQSNTTGGANTVIGNLQDLYLDLPNMAGNRFTDAHTRTFDIRVGQPVKMDPKECSWSRQDCAAAGLHFTADEIHYVGCGDTSVLILINPMKVVGIGAQKGRCYEYLPIMTVPRDEATKILHDIDFDTLQLDEDYAIKELATLTEQVKQGFVAEATKYEFNLPNISTAEINKIVSSLEEMKKILSKRVSVIK